MASGAVRLRLPVNVVRELLGSREAGVSRGIDDVLERYSERVEEDVLEKLLEERR